MSISLWLSVCNMWQINITRTSQTNHEWKESLNRSAIGYSVDKKSFINDYVDITVFANIVRDD